MKRAIALLFPVIGLASISNVRVTGTTATQAVIAYTAPDNNACTVAVSTSASYAPLVPDVDPTVFTGANTDSRPGSIFVGRSRFFVAGKRSVEQNQAGKNSSRALQAATTHYFQISCASDGSTASGSFTTATIPTGVSYGEPIPIDPANNGNYIYPTTSITDRNAWTIEPHTGALVKNMALPSDLQGGGTPYLTSSGSGVLCHPTPVKASDENKFGYHCQLFLSGYPSLYWIAPDGEARFLGIMNLPYTADWLDSEFCGGMLSAPFDQTDPNTFYCVADGYDASKGKPPGKYIIVKAVYTGHNAAGQDADLTNQLAGLGTGMPHTTFTQILPWGRDLVTMLTEFDPAYTTYGSTCCRSYLKGDWANSKFTFQMTGPDGQDTYGWVGIFDPNQTAALQKAKFGSAAGCADNPAVTGTAYTGQTGCIVASTGTFTGGPGSAFRWSALHGIIATPASPFLQVTLSSPDVIYRVTLSSPLSNTPGSGSCSMAKPAGSYIADWPDTSWNYGCSTVTVTGDPAASRTKAGYPASMPAAPGDFLSLQSGAFNTNEVMRLLDMGADGKTWYIQRRYYYGATWPYAAAAAGATMDMMTWSVYNSINYTGREVWWDYANGALTTNSTNTYRESLGPDHLAMVNHQTYGRWTTNGSYSQAGQEPGRLINPPTFLVQTVPSINGQHWGFADLAVEFHPSLPVTNPPDSQTYNQLLDNHPYFGASNFVTASNVTAAGGQLYRIRGLNVASLYKLAPYFANSGSRAMKEVSGPSVRLATDGSTQYQWCVALNAGECFGGSLAGDLYFNAPNIANAFCTYNWDTLEYTLTIPNDICVAPAHALVQAVKTEALVNDPLGLQSRVISNALGKYDQQSNFWNSGALPDGSWLFTKLAADDAIKLIRMPPRGPDTVNRTQYIPVGISLGTRAGIASATVEFGYAENGNPGAYYCTARQEACVAQSGAIDFSRPFYFATTEAASITGMPCASGCTVTIPGVSGRMVYYRVDSRDASGKVIEQQTGVQAVP